MTWELIETAPHDEGVPIVGWREGWDYPWILIWKWNTRIDKWYFGDPHESDDYDLVEEGPTHWKSATPPETGGKSCD